MKGIITNDVTFKAETGEKCKLLSGTKVQVIRLNKKTAIINYENRLGKIDLHTTRMNLPTLKIIE